MKTLYTFLFLLLSLHVHAQYDLRSSILSDADIKDFKILTTDFWTYAEDDTSEESYFWLFSSDGLQIHNFVYDGYMHNFKYSWHRSDRIQFTYHPNLVGMEMNYGGFAGAIKEVKKPLKYLVMQSSKRDFADEYEIKKLTEDTLVIKMLCDPEHIYIGNTYTHETKLVKVDYYVYFAAYLRASLALTNRIAKEQKEKNQ